MFEGERALGPTFALADIGWVDFETRSAHDLTQVGAYRYAVDADAIMCAWAIGEASVEVTAVDKFPGSLAWLDMPPAFRKHHARVLKGQAIWAAWNAGFDRAIWNYATNMFHILEHNRIIDVMAQAAAAGLPADLMMASRLCGTEKLEAGKDLIKLFCGPEDKGDPVSCSAQWHQFKAYARGDIEAMRAVFLRTRQLSLAEWKEYWTMEGINARGVAIDVAMAEHAAKLASEDRERSRRNVHAITKGAVTSVDMVKRITDWVLPQLPAEGCSILTKREEEVDDKGEVTRPPKYQLTRRRVEKLLAYCKAQLEDPNTEDSAHEALSRVYDVLQIRYYGGSRTPAKFSKMLRQHVDGVLYGQYVFNGAGQTGRASSRGVQVHNLARDTLPYEYEAIEALLAGCSYDDLNELSDGFNVVPVCRKLSLLIRPTFVPRNGCSFVWSDWSQIEARILPWLAGEVSSGALKRLQVFRDVDANSKLPDLYTRTTADICHITIDQVTKALRQRGKVAELALGFGGGVGALQAMGAGYGLYLTEEESRAIVNSWRVANPWCVQFWGQHNHDASTGLWGAINRALLNPRKEQHTGRLTYCYLPDYLLGSLICVLPSGRLLTYRAIRHDQVEELDDDDQPTGRYTTQLRFSRNYGRHKLWHGLACENVVQAVAADILRGTLRRLEDEHLDVRLHTHDEILLEASDEMAGVIATSLREVMTRGFDWSEGLPLVSHETISPYYTKTED